MMLEVNNQIGKGIIKGTMYFSTRQRTRTRDLTKPLTCLAKCGGFRDSTFGVGTFAKYRAHRTLLSTKLDVQKSAASRIIGTQRTNTETWLWRTSMVSCTNDLNRMTMPQRLRLDGLPCNQSRVRNDHLL
jgi:hypothetical protein